MSDRATADAMTMRAIVLLAALAALCGCASPRGAMSTSATATPVACEDDADWNTPTHGPIRIHGDTWYVGTCGISAILVATKAGHVLIDGAVDAAAPQIEANIRAAGLRVEDVRYVLNTHAHHDHAGGIARLQRDSGATVLASAWSAETLRRGRGDHGDPQFLTSNAFAPVANVAVLPPDGRVELGGMTLTAHATPGHTPGGTSWTWRSCDTAGCVDIAYVDSLTPMTDDAYRYSDDAAHPGALDAFRAGLDAVAALPCDVLVTPHPAASDLWSRIGPRASAPLVQRDACMRYADAARARLSTRLDEEAKTK